MPPISATTAPMSSTRFVQQNDRQAQTGQTAPTPATNFSSTLTGALGAVFVAFMPGAEPPKETKKEPAKPATYAIDPENLTFTQPDHKTVLQNLRARLDKGETLSVPEQQLVDRPTIGSLAAITVRVNQALNNIPKENRQIITPAGIHVHKDANIPEDTRKGLEDGSIKFEALTKEQRDAVLAPLEGKDIMPLPKGRKETERDFIAQFKPDGTGFPYTFLPPHALSKIGGPTLAFSDAKGDIIQDIPPESIKTVYYKNPQTGKIERGVYFEVLEIKINKKEKKQEITGINGVIVPPNQATILINAHDIRKKGGEGFIIRPLPPPEI